MDDNIIITFISGVVGGMFGSILTFVRLYIGDGWHREKVDQTERLHEQDTYREEVVIKNSKGDRFRNTPRVFGWILYDVYKHDVYNVLYNEVSADEVKLIIDIRQRINPEHKDHSHNQMSSHYLTRIFENLCSDHDDGYTYTSIALNLLWKKTCRRHKIKAWKKYLHALAQNDNHNNRKKFLEELWAK